MKKYHRRSVVAAMSVLFAALLFSATSISAELLPVELYSRPDAVQAGSFNLSPTGEYFAVIIPQDDRSSLIIFDRATNKPTANITPAKGQYINAYDWVSNKRVVLSMAEKNGDLSTPAATGELWGIDADGSHKLYLFGYRGGMTVGTKIKRSLATMGSAYVLEPLADENNTILIATRSWGTTGEQPFADMARLNVETGRLQKTEGGIPLRYFSNVLVDQKNHARMISGTTTDRYKQLLYRSSKASGWVNINDEHKTNRAIQPLAYASNGIDIYAQVSEPGMFDYLIQLNPETMLEKKIYAPKTADIGGVFRTADRKDVYAIRNFDGLGGYVFLDNTLPESILVKTLMAQFPGQLVIANSFSLDGRFASVFVSSDINAGEYYIFDRDTNKLSLAVGIRSSIRPDDAAVVEPIEYKARDGLTIHGWLTKPNSPSGKMPLIVLPHGGPYGIVDRWEFNPEAQLFASRGYAVLQINFRGSGGYGLDFINAGFREWGGRMQQDITDGTRWLIGQNEIDEKKICIYGSSYGAYAALMGVATEPDLFKCAIGYAGIYDLAAMSRQGDIDDTAFGRKYLEDIFENNQEWLQARSPSRLASQIKAPILLIHGGEDQRAVPAQAKAMQTALTVAGNPPQWLYESTEGHGFFDPKKRLNAYTTMLNFLDLHIGKNSKP